MDSRQFRGQAMSLGIERLTAALADRYRIDGEIGQGGMATVYRAHDLRHDRQVAIKIVHPDLAATLGPERFLAEIKTTAKLQHPHILPLLDSGEAEGVLYYVMPFVAGESLRHRLTREQQLPIDEAVRITRQVADALAHAHAQGIVHRDIKPENILLQEGHALVADFGIALAVTAAGGPRMTQTGLSLGTPQYMSPEQAMGERTLDARTDVYALGAVGYEMLTGEPPFTGATVQAIVAKVLSAEPQLPTLIRKTIPPHVEGAILKALAKLPADRFGKASEFAAALADPGAATGYATRATPAKGGAPSRMSGSTRALLGLTTSLALAGTGSAVWFATREAPMPAAVRFDVALPDSVRLYEVSGRRLALSRDGTQLVVVGTRADRTSLYHRRMDETEFRQIPGSERVGYGGNVDPTFSPDGASILFRADEVLQRIPVTGGRAERVGPGMSGSWGDGDRIVFVTGDTLWQTTPEGTTRRPISVPGTAPESWGFRWPSVLPGGRYVLVNIQRRAAATIGEERLGVVSLEDGTIEDLGILGTNPLYSSTGHVVFTRATGEVFAVPFSLGSRKVLGPPVRILEGIWVGGAGAMGVAVSQTGMLAYHEGEFGGGRRTLRIVRDDGTDRLVPGDVQQYFAPRVSPDGRRVLVENNGEDRSAPVGPIVLLDVRTGAVQRVAAPGEGLAPEWSRDGRRVAFLRFLGLIGREIVSRSSDRSGEDQVLLRDSSLVLFDFRLGSAGGWSLVRSGSPGAERRFQDILLAPADSLAKMRPFLSTDAHEVTPDLSPDGHWLAYGSDESGRREVYVQPVPGPGPRLQISIAGGGEPIWSPAGGTLFYRSAERFVMAARVETAPLRVARWDTLFVDRFLRGPSTTNWSVFPNGREFLMIGGEGANEGPKMVVNWPQLPALMRPATEPR